MLRVILLFIIFFPVSLLPANAQIDLHAHLVMQPGLNGFLQGGLSEPARSSHWSQLLKSKVSLQTLAQLTEKNRPQLIVVSLYAHPYLSYSFTRDGFHFDRLENVRRTIENEYQLLIAFVENHSDHYAIAKNAREARGILKQKKTAIVLSIEGAWGTFERAADYDRWINERGLAIMTPVHLTPDHFGGVAQMTPWVAFLNSTSEFFHSLWESKGSCLKVFCRSSEGFSPEGEAMVDEFIKRGVWIDTAHSNEIEIELILKKLRNYKPGQTSQKPRALPLLVTHTQLRKHIAMERALGDLEIDYIKENDGIVGLIPTEKMIPIALEQEFKKTNTTNGESAESAGQGVPCVSGLDIFKQIVEEASTTLGSTSRVSLGSDINAPLNGLSPGCGQIDVKSSTNLNTSLAADLLDLHRRGFYTYSQWNALSYFVAPNSSWETQSLEHFLKLWAQVRP